MRDILLICQNTEAWNGRCPQDKHVFMHAAGGPSLEAKEAPAGDGIVDVPTPARSGREED